MSKKKLNNLQHEIFELFSKPGNFDNLNISIEVLKTRISFKEGRLNHFILFPRKGIMILHLNLRKWPDQLLLKGFHAPCFNRAIQYAEFEISDDSRIQEIINYLKSGIQKKVNIKIT